MEAEFGSEMSALLTLVLVNSVGELVDGWGDLQSHEEHGLLSLDTDVLGPLDESGEVADGLDVTTDTEVLGALLEEGGAGVLSLLVADDNLSLDSFLNLILNHR